MNVDSLLNGRNMLCFNFSFCKQLRSDAALKQQAFFSHLDQDQPHQLTHVHPTDHLLKPENSQHSPLPPQKLWKTELLWELLKFCGLQLLARVEGPTVDLPVKLSSDILQCAVVSKCPPFGINTHPAFISLHQVNVSELLHVTCISAGTWRDHSRLCHSQMLMNPEALNEHI